MPSLAILNFLFKINKSLAKDFNLHLKSLAVTYGITGKRFGIGHFFRTKSLTRRHEQGCCRVMIIGCSKMTVVYRFNCEFFQETSKIHQLLSCATNPNAHVFAEPVNAFPSDLPAPRCQSPFLSSSFSSEAQPSPLLVVCAVLPSPPPLRPLQASVALWGLKKSQSLRSFR